MNTLPYCYFPTSVCHIGNIDSNHLKNRYLSFEPGKDNLITPQSLPLLFDRLSCQGHDLFDLSSLNYLYEEVYNRRRYEAVSCLVYREKNLHIHGLALLQKLEDCHAKKILVTQDKDEKKVVTAFNEGLINFYVCTQDPKFNSLLEEFIQQSQQAYFRDSVNALIHPLLEKWQRDNATLPALLDPLFIKFLQAFIKDRTITEYYLLDITGSFLLIDQHRQPSVLFVFTEQNFKEHGQAVDRFLQSNHRFAAEIVESLITRRQTICFPFIYPQGQVQVDRYIEPVQILEGQQRYYIAHSRNVDYLREF